MTQILIQTAHTVYYAFINHCGTNVNETLSIAGDNNALLLIDNHVQQSNYCTIVAHD